ncbi:MAG TPA: LysR family transcriptional regulator [Stenotrophomonas sp.]|nr:LysR family transcriptional regulator [Stenotrophomonas sp.]
MQLKALRYFLMVASTSSFLATARHFRVPASSVSRFIAALEKDLGRQLFYRSTRAVRLTEDGERFHQQVREAIELLDAAVDDLGRDDGGLSGRLRINAPEAFGRLHVARLLNALQAAHPALDVELQLTDAYIDPVQEGVDITVRIGPQVDSGLIGRTVAAQQQIVAASPAYLAVHGTPQVPADLLDHRCLLYKGQFGTQRWYFREEASQAFEGINVSGPLCSNNAEVLLAAALEGHGVVLFPSWLYRHESFAKQQLVPLLGAWEGSVATETSYIQLLSPENKLRSRKVREVTAFLLEGFGTPPAWDL